MSCENISKKELCNRLHQVNDDIEGFIKNSIESQEEIKMWSQLSDDYKPIRCWEIKGCKKTECPAYGKEDYRCWLFAGTFCGGKVQGEFAKKLGTCFKCDVFQLIKEEPLRRLYENIDILIYHLQKRATSLWELAIKDPLTGLYNRHFFNVIIERETASADRKDETLSFLIIDLDDFKKINDTLGHLTGDKVLIEVASLIKNTIRKADLAIRYGGDEFLVFMKDSDCDRTSNMFERLKESVERWNKDNAEDYGCKLSFSAGCSICKRKCDVQVALKEADERMYQNKREKRNNEVGQGGIHEDK